MILLVDKVGNRCYNIKAVGREYGKHRKNGKTTGVARKKEAGSAEREIVKESLDSWLKKEL